VGSAAKRDKTVDNAHGECVRNASISGLSRPHLTPLSMCKIAKLMYVAGAEIPKKYLGA
jgi:hypothetical protein